MNTLSVIVPCHDHAFFKECLESLAEQTDKDFQTIVIFDKCEDDSPRIADSFKDRLNLTLLITSGGKPSIARNAGIESCKTEYFTFLDSDDYFVSKEAVENIKAAVKAYREKNGKPLDCFRHKVSGDDGLVIRSFCFSWTVRKEFADSHNLRFNTRLTYLEDLKWEIDMRFANTEFRHYPFGFVMLDLELTYHRVNPNSICHNVQRRLDTEYEDYNHVFSGYLTENLSLEQREFLSLVYIQTTFRILAERSAFRKIPFTSLLKKAQPLIRQYCKGMLSKGYTIDYNGKRLPLWSLLKLDCERTIVPTERQDELMGVLIKNILK